MRFKASDPSPKVMYRILEIDGEGQFKTLFHGLNGSRTIPVEQWLKAVKKMVSDNGPKYLSGFHVMRTRNQAYEYLDRFTDKPDRYLTVVVVQTKGRLRRKKHANAEVWLADWMRIMPAPGQTEQAWKYLNGYI